MNIIINLKDHRKDHRIQENREYVIQKKRNGEVPRGRLKNPKKRKHSEYSTETKRKKRKKHPPSLRLYNYSTDPGDNFNFDNDSLIEIKPSPSASSRYDRDSKRNVRIIRRDKYSSKYSSKYESTTIQEFGGHSRHSKGSQTPGTYKRNKRYKKKMNNKQRRKRNKAKQKAFTPSLKMVSEVTSLSGSKSRHNGYIIDTPQHHQSCDSMESVDMAFREYIGTEYGDGSYADSMTTYSDSECVDYMKYKDEKWQNGLLKAYERGFNKGYSLGVQFKMSQRRIPNLTHHLFSK